jgi:pimeloyl-ACP methyl ester carboxylesterase
MAGPSGAKTASPPLAIDKTVNLDINGSAQKIRICAERAGLPPLLIVQAGPGLPLLHEVRKFQRHLHLELDFLVGYWEQRGCGSARAQDARSVSLQQQVKDLRAVLQWFRDETKQVVILLGISIGGTLALQAAALEPEAVKSVVAISPDANTAASDAAVDAFLEMQSAAAENRGLARKLEKLGKPPYTDSAAFQRRARLLSDLGGIERGKKFSALLKETLFGMIRAYGLVGATKALRNLGAIQTKLLPELASLDLFADPPRLAVPAHYVFGEQDPLTPGSIVEKLPAAIPSPSHTVIVAPNAGHMVHFDQPDLVRSAVMAARIDAQ